MPATSTANADQARQDMVDTLLRLQTEWNMTPISARVEEVLRKVPRHAFVPEASLAEAYETDYAVPIRRAEDGLITSSMSAVRVQAMMLDQAGLEPGMRVLEIGSGGYNAALASELVGPAGEVTTVDIDADVTGRARRYLDATGYGNVRVVTRDAEFGVAEFAPYDRIIVTVRAWDLPPAWTAQLAGGGRLVAPMRLRGVSRTVAFDLADDGHLVSRPDHHLTVFVPMQGAGAHEERGIAVQGEDIALYDVEESVDVAALRAALHGPRAEFWPGVEFVYPDRMHLWTAAHADRHATLHISGDVVEHGPAGRVAQRPTPVVLADGGSVAVRAKRATGGGRFETGVFAYGPHGREAAEHYVDILRAWAKRKDTMARIEVWPSGTPDADLPEDRVRVLDKPHTRTVLSWP
ncbi:methyltransferase, FxLD system [Streptomonospora nanhaiensis]|uniref:Protein-L-isoaspartate O-methyltransferase n=1 Tax=Streptomonospora nanhaiensis TaxID=1323731 RepID=A0A853BYK5_9ACTN|nr:methyltransferase, FxLD system [Streptomonospora nanhaiensis]MBV2364676.1 methyltransferase, FxLD system [Streptomonospora nanhaiensis]MBX9389539.1 methyltransferase, FxLD system [Streptomonospora nanhaiensis]NYI99232.1 protein-L-isoaspartate(D-aspartate) O-methyltransferase [Streptomonospora nanhaiensis]